MWSIGTLLSLFKKEKPVLDDSSIYAEAERRFTAQTEEE